VLELFQFTGRFGSIPGTFNPSNTAGIYNQQSQTIYAIKSFAKIAMAMTENRANLFDISDFFGLAFKYLILLKN
jgi:hypothetical protein